MSWVGGNLNSTAHGAQITYPTSYLAFPQQHSRGGALAWKVRLDCLASAHNSEATGCPSHVNSACCSQQNEVNQSVP